MLFLSFTPNTSSVSKVEKGVLLCEPWGFFCFAKHFCQSSSTFDKFFSSWFSKGFSLGDSRDSILFLQTFIMANNPFKWMMSVSFSRHISPRNSSHLVLFSTYFAKPFFATNFFGSRNNFVGSSTDKGNAIEPPILKPLFHKPYSKKVNNKRLCWKLHAPPKTCIVGVCINRVNNKRKIYKPEPPIELVFTWSQRCYNRHFTLL